MESLIAFRISSTKSTETDALCFSVFHLAGIPDNETAYRLAKQGAAGDQGDNSVSFREIKTCK